MNDIKLVIWDLDNTFWQGNLGEGKVILPETNKNIIRTLVNRGIMNSVCSKNNYEAVKELLVKHGIWDCFIFPMVSHNPKGEIVKQIIENSQLRAENVLFIDDEQINLEEVLYYNPGINVKGSDFVEELLNHKSLEGKHDIDRTRLKQYKLLEEKSLNKASYASNEAFLMDCNIQVQIIEDCMAHIDRIHEMIQRTNQLNYTKKRIGKEELLSTIKNPNVRCACVQVADKFGDYGVSGFYAIEENCLKHFLFSCRVMNLGIEQWIYKKLECPEIDIVGEVAIGLSKDSLPYWINTKQHSANNYKCSNADIDKHQKKCLIYGGCDLEQLYHYLNNDGFTIETAFSYVSHKGIPIHNEHSEILRSNYTLTSSVKSLLMEKLPFYDKDMYKFDIFDPKYNLLIYSVLMDYTQGLYSLKNNSDVIIAYGDYNQPLTDPENRDIIIELSKGIIDEPFLEWFGKNFDFIGPLSEKKFQENLVWMRSSMSKDCKLVLLNGSEIELEHRWEKGRWVRHKDMNKILADFCKKSDNTYLIDVNKYIKSSEDVEDNIRHYKRHHYKYLADEINVIMSL